MRIMVVVILERDYGWGITVRNSKVDRFALCNIYLNGGEGVNSQGR